MTKKSFTKMRDGLRALNHAIGVMVGVLLLPIGAGWFLLRKHLSDLAALHRASTVDDARARRRLANETAAAVLVSFALTASVFGVATHAASLSERASRLVLGGTWPLALAFAAFPVVTHAFGTLAIARPQRFDAARAFVAVLITAIPFAFLAARGTFSLATFSGALAISTVAIAAGARWTTTFVAASPFVSRRLRAAVHVARLVVAVGVFSAFFSASPMTPCRSAPEASCASTELAPGIATRGSAELTVTASPQNVLVEALDGGGAGRIESPHPIEHAYLETCGSALAINVHTTYGTFCTRIDERGVRLDDGFLMRLGARAAWLHAFALAALLVSTVLLGAHQARG